MNLKHFPLVNKQSRRNFSKKTQILDFLMKSQRQKYPKLCHFCKGWNEKIPIMVRLWEKQPALAKERQLTPVNEENTGKHKPWPLAAIFSFQDLEVYTHNHLFLSESTFAAVHPWARSQCKISPAQKPHLSHGFNRNINEGGGWK